MPDVSFTATPATPAVTRILEICVDDLAGLAAAVTGGADRIELCAALALGGLTPSPGFVARAVATDVPVDVMIRPRAGDFAYSVDERDLMADDIVRFAAMGVAGFVTGAASSDGRLDRDALARWRDAAPGCRAVIHRVIDLVPDAGDAVETACDAGYDFVLSSGGERRAIDGTARLAAMVAVADRRLGVIAGAGVSADNVAALVHATGVSQVHASASETAQWADPRMASFGFATGPRRATSAAAVTALRAALHAA